MMKTFVHVVFSQDSQMREGCRLRSKLILDVVGVDRQPVSEIAKSTEVLAVHLEHDEIVFTDTENSFIQLTVFNPISGEWLEERKFENGEWEDFASFDVGMGEIEQKPQMLCQEPGGCDSPAMAGGEYCALHEPAL